MARFPSLPDHAGVPDILRRFPAGVRALLEYHDAILRGASPLTVAERELIAAYVSGLNTCGYCHGAHRMIAEVVNLVHQAVKKIAVVRNKDQRSIVVPQRFFKHIFGTHIEVVGRLVEDEHVHRFEKEFGQSKA